MIRRATDQAQMADCDPAASTTLISIVVPVFNEAPTVARVLNQLALLPFRKQIIVVDDGSTDGTRESLERISRHWQAGIEMGEVGRIGANQRPATATELLIVAHPVNRGKGAALRSGFRAALGEFVVVQDADLEYAPEEIPRLLEPLLAGRADAVFGSRFLTTGPAAHRWWHHWGNWFLTQASNWFTGVRLSDMETCHKALRTSLLRQITLDQDRFGVEPELTAKLVRRGARILEVPVSYRARSYADGKKIGVRDLWQALYCIVRYGVRD